MQLTNEQESALLRIEELREQGVAEVRLVGPAGTGKTTLMKHLVRNLEGEDVVVVTPTNKAAKVLRTKGVEAYTLYAVFFTPEDEIPGHLGRSGSVRFLANDQLHSKLGEGKRDFADTIVVDEASMLQTWLIQHLRRMCNTLILVGDPHQLPPVNDRSNPNGYFCTAKPHAELTTVMRQDEGSPILELATHIRNGRFPEPLVRSLAPSATFAQWLTPENKIIAFTNNHRRAINMVARQVLGFDGVLPKAGDRMVCLDNIDPGLLNGTEVVVERFSWKMPARFGEMVCRDEDGKQRTVSFNVGKFLRDMPDGSYPAAKLEHVINAGVTSDEAIAFTYAYCITAHKSQGSEWDAVCVIDERYVLAKVDPGGDTARRWCYTAITRAAKELVFADYRWIKNEQKRRQAA